MSVTFLLFLGSSKLEILYDTRMRSISFESSEQGSTGLNLMKYVIAFQSILSQLKLHKCNVVLIEQAYLDFCSTLYHMNS